MAWRQTWPVDPDSVSETKGRRGKKKESEREKEEEKHIHRLALIGVLSHLA